MDGHVNDATQGVSKDLPQDVAQDLAFGAWAARALLATAPPPPPPSLQLALRWGRKWAAQWHLARAVGKRFRGCRAKRLYVHMPFHCSSALAHCHTLPPSPSRLSLTAPTPPVPISRLSPKSRGGLSPG